ncbi:MAG: preprotein translocase subunit SecG [Candidatus Paceibacterota bacterium]
MVTILPIIQIILAVILITTILLQRSSAGIGSLGGGESVDAGYHTRRGFEKTLFNATIIIAIAFVVISFIIFVLA